MREKDIAATCIPVQYDDRQWESAFFFHVSGPESKQDRRILKKQKITPAVLMAELMTHASAAVVMLRVEVGTIMDDPLVFEILLTPGHVTMHYECLKLLARQERIRYFFSDSDYRILQEQEQEISDAQHQNFETLARESFAHDTMIRMAGKYDALAALSEIVARYQVRQEHSQERSKVEH